MTAGKKTELKRTIGLAALTLYGIGDILGAGVYGLIGKAAGEMGSAVWLAFFVSMVAAGLTGLSYASLSSRYPKAGGASYVTYRAFGNSALSYMVGLTVLASGLTSMATAARVFSGYLCAMFPFLPLTLTALVFSVLLMLLVFWGIKEALIANGVCTLVEIGGLLLILIFGATYVGSTNYFDAITPTNPTGDITLSLCLTGAVLTFYSFIGFEDMFNVAEEVKDPRITLPRALIGAVLISSLIYMAISIVAVSVIPPAELALSRQPLVDVMRKAAPWFPTQLYSVIALFAVANTALLNYIMGSRLLYGMSNQGLLPIKLSTIHERTKTPYVAIVTMWLLFVILIVSGDISSLAKSTSVLLLICFIIVNASLVVLKRKEKIPGSFEIPSIVPICGALICGAMLWRAKAPEWITAGSLIAVILVLYAVLRPTAKAIESIDELN